MGSSILRVVWSLVRATLAALVTLGEMSIVSLDEAATVAAILSNNGSINSDGVLGIIWNVLPGRHFGCFLLDFLIALLVDLLRQTMGWLVLVRAIRAVG